MDATIERYIKDGDLSRALNAISEAHGAALGRFLAATLGSREDGEEALQDTLIATHSALSSYRGDRGLRPWLFGIARHVALSRVRRQSRRRSLWARLFAPEPPPDPIAQADARLTLSVALARLTPDQRDALLLRYQLGLDATEVADTLAISHAAARQRIAQGLRRLRAELEDTLPEPVPSLSESRP